MKTKTPWLLVLLWIATSIVTLFPIYWLFVITVKQPVELFTTAEVILGSVQWGNYT